MTAYKASRLEYNIRARKNMVYMVRTENIIDNSGRMKPSGEMNLKKNAIRIWKRGGVWKLNGLPSAPPVASQEPCKANTPSSQSMRLVFPRFTTL